MLKVDVLQVFISTSAIFGIGLVWINFNEKVFKTVRNLVAAPFSWPNKEADPEEEYDSEEHVCEACWADTEENFI